MADTLDPRFIDKRTAARYLRNGLLDEKAYEKHLKALPDLAKQALPVTVDLAGEDFGDEDGVDGEGVPEETPLPAGGV